MINCNGEIIFVSEICVKVPQKPNFDSKRIRILGGNGINSKLKHRNVHNPILRGGFADLYLGELARMIITLAF